MDENSGKKDKMRPVNDYIHEAPRPTIPTLECHSEFLKNLKKQQQQQQPMSYMPQSQPQSQSQFQPAGPAPMSNYFPYPSAPAAPKQETPDIQVVYNQLMSQFPEFAQNPVLLQALQTLALNQNKPQYPAQTAPAPGPPNYYNQSMYSGGQPQMAGQYPGKALQLLLLLSMN